ncbi:putative baseplate assembly protein [Phytoactinopolyspora alkaliphila]|uniref:Putative baseplate assembly protein n=1 Tax=Phytoactinopolyspora alkaliphila TaxID=1783498 RepID=A0A6N9YFL7_9ACTN|nr:putative baseplate assembly protein [Phytoactinopolyspora alkaliphila]NED93730.1 putative baseplate assembly protein [Phytoactinopolyspora alkaliphila]
MPLPAPNLDDRRFQDLVDEAKRLIPQFCPEWTNHNVGDPGVALIELFAWMSESVLFRLNQVPEKLYVHFLNLVGIEPFPPAVARTDITFWLSTALEQVVTVPAGTEVSTGSGDERPVVFSTTTELSIRPPRFSALLTIDAGERVTDRWEEFTALGVPVECFTPGLTPGDAFYLGFEESLAGTAVRLGLGAEAEGIGVDPRRPPLTWEAWTGEAWAGAAVHRDTTGGLNRDGDVVIMAPMRHAPLSLGGTSAHWLRGRLLLPAPGQPGYRVSPRIRTLSASAVGGTVPAEHATVMGTESLGRSTGAPGQTFAVSTSPVLPRRDGESIRVIDRSGASTWDEVMDFSHSGPGDRHVVWDSSTGEVRFGPRVRYPDGHIRQHGAVPPDGAEVVVTRYRCGGGQVGNVGARTLTELRATVSYVSGAVNLAAAAGGVDAETVDEAKVRGPMTLRTGSRAVTAGDFERLAAEASAQVARARCLPARPVGDPAGRTVSGPVRVMLVPHVRTHPRDQRLDDFALSAALLDVVRDHLDRHRLVGTAVEVGTPYYQGVSVAAMVRAQPGRPAELVRQRVEDELTRYINPLTGGPEGSGWPFETDLSFAAVSQLVEAVDGVDRMEEVLLFEFDLRTGRRIGSGRDIIRLEPDSLFLSAAHQVVVR